VRVHGRVAVLALFALLAVALLGAAKPTLQGKLRAPRPDALIRQSLAEGPHAGDCEQCHTTHGDDQPTVYPNALTSPDDNSLCARCHASEWSGGSFGGDVLYRGTGHGASTRMIWPGPDPGMRLEVDAATKCLNCHDPHGWADAQGAIPMLAVQREERLCLACHDGTPAATDIASDLHKAYRHPTADFTGRHAGPGESLPSDFGVSPVNRRHAECEDCHNPHVSRADAGSLDGTSEPSKTTLGVSRVLVQNGFAGQRPLYTFIGAADSLTAPYAEYQLCFKCHSSWTTQPAGQTDLAVELNPANASYHPVEAEGRNPNISALAFAPGWSSSSLTRCGSCHGSDFSRAAGPHGSSNPFLLRQPYKPATGERPTASDELCFSCHAYEVYANPGAPSSVLEASRFNGPQGGNGHADHVGKFSVPCYSCHVTHGSATLPYLLVTGRNPGLLAYTSSATGGTCTSSCHGVESYTLSYAR
jgi:predicted CXXCH cytochrome family protein